MSQSLILACPAACDLSVFSGVLERAARGRAATFLSLEGELQVIGSGHSFYLALSEMGERDATALDYESNDDLDEQFRGEVLALRFYALRFNDFDVTKRVLLELVTELGALGMDPWIDTDYGWVIRGSDAMARMNHDPSWDWRKPAPG